MWSMPLSYRTFIISMQRQPNIIFQFFITYFFQEEVLMQNLTHTTDSMSTLYVGKGPYYTQRKDPKS
jgi:hypothetical protein